MTTTKLTKAQSHLVRMMNLYPDNIFIEIIENFDDPDFWKNLDPSEELTDEKCLDLCGVLASHYQEWNKF
jgi:hypothetical protein